MVREGGRFGSKPDFFANADVAVIFLLVDVVALSVHTFFVERLLGHIVVG